jgi:predicted ATP-dependent endonuclease of OLD family
MFISEFKIDNFRSLRNIHLKDMRPVCIFHGENNSGKSNILAAIEAILRAKTIIEDPGVVDDATATGKPTLAKQVSFHQGMLRGFADNFRFGSKDPIPFLLSLTFENSELAANKGVLEQIESEAKSKGAKSLAFDDEHKKIIRIQGELKFVDEDTCEAITHRVDLNGDYILFQLDEPSFIPSLEGSKAVSLADRAKVVADILNAITDSFQLIGTHRTMRAEKLNINEPPSDFLTPGTFKRSLFRLATNRDTYDSFKQIKELFNAEPFFFGDISFAVDPKTGEVEIMIEKATTRLPLNRMGSGLQQILFLIANIVHNSRRMIGVEEIELNLSPTGQKRIFETLKSIVYQSHLINQVLVTSHSPYFRNRKDVKYFEVTYDAQSLNTSVKLATKPAEKKFFEIPMGGWEQP